MRRTLHLVLFIGLLSGCPGTLDDPGRFDRVAEDAAVVPVPLEGCGSIESDLLAKRCATSGCHSGSGPSVAPDLRSPNLFSRIANEPASGGGLILVPGDPKASVLYQKLGTSPPYGGRMPVGAPLDDTAIDCVRRWIEVNR